MFRYTCICDFCANWAYWSTLLLQVSCVRVQYVVTTVPAGTLGPHGAEPSAVNVLTANICVTFSKIILLLKPWNLFSLSSRHYSRRPVTCREIKENTKAPSHWPLCGEFTGDRWIPRKKGPVTRKCFHLMTSSWIGRIYVFCVTATSCFKL